MSKQVYYIIRQACNNKSEASNHEVINYRQKQKHVLPKDQYTLMRNASTLNYNSKQVKRDNKEINLH